MKFKHVFLGLFAFVMSASFAIAADVDRRRGGHIIAKAEPIPTLNWGGFYVGGNFGTGFGTDSVTGSQTNTGTFGPFVGQFANPTDGRPRGWLYGLQAGVNHQIAQGLVIGIEGDFKWSTIKVNANSSSTNPITASASAEQTSQDLKWVSTVRGRVGVLPWSHVMLYGTGGVAFGKVETCFNTQGTLAGFAVGNGGQCSGATKTGWTVGGGVEAALTRNWSVKAEYAYIDLGTVSGSYVGTSAAPLGTTRAAFAYGSEYNFHTMSLGVNYRF